MNNTEEKGCEFNVFNASENRKERAENSYKWMENRHHRDVPVWEKSNLTLEEAAAYFGIGTGKLRQITNGEHCPYVLWVGNKRLIKRVPFEEYLKKSYSL